MSGIFYIQMLMDMLLVYISIYLYMLYDCCIYINIYLIIFCVNIFLFYIDIFVFHLLFIIFYTHLFSLYGIITAIFKYHLLISMTMRDTQFPLT